MPHAAVAVEIASADMPSSSGLLLHARHHQHPSCHPGESEDKECQRPRESRESSTPEETAFSLAFTATLARRASQPLANTLGLGRLALVASNFSSTTTTVRDSMQNNSTYDVLVASSVTRDEPMTDWNATSSEQDISSMGLTLFSMPWAASHDSDDAANVTDFPDDYSGFMHQLWDANGTWNREQLINIATMAGTAVALGFIILATVIGNIFVIVAILIERNLQSVANYLILSLAVADLLVACLVMPLGALYEVNRQWTLGPELCDMWTASDVLCCTASILHLVAIALDRYWAVTNIDYIHQRTACRVGIMIFIVWVVAGLVCVAPILGLKDPGWETRVIKDQECMVSQDLFYQIFATAFAFYLPLFVILVLYWRIFQTARKRIRRRVQAQTAVAGRAVPGGPKNPSSGGVIAGAAGGTGGLAAAVVGMIGRPLPTISEATTTTTTTAFTNVSSSNNSPEKTSFANGLEIDPPTVDQMSCNPYQESPHHHHHYPIKRKSKEAMDSKRERKAAKTLAIITGAFVICWLPFFISAVLQPACDSCYFNKYMMSFFLWLGYFNSTLNPIIYTIFSPEFRHAFKRILCGRKSTLRRRHRHFDARARYT